VSWEEKEGEEVTVLRLDIMYCMQLRPRPGGERKGGGVRGLAVVDKGNCKLHQSNNQREKQQARNKHHNYNGGNVRSEKEANDYTALHGTNPPSLSPPRNPSPRSRR